MTDQGGHPAMTEPTTPQQPTPESRAPWTFDRREGEPFTLANAVFQALGRASTCWESLSGAGVFDSTTAKDVGDALLLEIRNVRDADNAAALARLDPSGAVAELLDALRLTVEYVGTSTLPPIAGWSWFDALRKYAPAIADRFVEQHQRTRADVSSAAVTEQMIDAFNQADRAYWLAHTPVTTQGKATSVARAATRAGLEAALRLLAHQTARQLADVAAERDERLTLAESSRLARRYDDAAYDRDREKAKAAAYLLRGDHLAAALDNLIKAVERNVAGDDQPTDIITAVGRARKVLDADPEAYGQHIPPPRPADPPLRVEVDPARNTIAGPLPRRRPGRPPERPTLCRIVRYVGKHGINAHRAAVVSCTVDELDPAGDAPALTDAMHVHLFVTTPSDRGFFVEYNVPHDPDGAPGTWHWPTRPGGPAGDLFAGSLVVHPSPEVRLVPVPIDPRGGGMRA